MTAATRDAGRMPNARRAARRERNRAVRRQMAIEAEARRGGLSTADAMTSEDPAPECSIACLFGCPWPHICPRRR